MSTIETKDTSQLNQIYTKTYDEIRLYTVYSNPTRALEFFNVSGEDLTVNFTVYGDTEPHKFVSPQSTSVSTSASLYVVQSKPRYIWNYEILDENGVVLTLADPMTSCVDFGAEPGHQVFRDLNLSAYVNSSVYSGVTALSVRFDTLTGSILSTPLDDNITSSEMFTPIKHFDTYNGEDNALVRPVSNVYRMRSVSGASTGIAIRQNTESYNGLSISVIDANNNETDTWYEGMAGVQTYYKMGRLMQSLDTIVLTANSNTFTQYPKVKNIFNQLTTMGGTPWCEGTGNFANVFSVGDVWYSDSSTSALITTEDCNLFVFHPTNPFYTAYVSCTTVGNLSAYALSSGVSSASAYLGQIESGQFGDASALFAPMQYAQSINMFSPYYKFSGDTRLESILDNAVPNKYWNFGEITDSLSGYFGDGNTYPSFVNTDNTSTIGFISSSGIYLNVEKNAGLYTPHGHAICDMILGYEDAKNYIKKNLSIGLSVSSISGVDTISDLLSTNVTSSIDVYSLLNSNLVLQTINTVGLDDSVVESSVAYHPQFEISGFSNSTVLSGSTSGSFTGLLYGDVIDYPTYVSCSTPCTGYTISNDIATVYNNGTSQTSFVIPKDSDFQLLFDDAVKSASITASIPISSIYPTQSGSLNSVNTFSKYYIPQSISLNESSNIYKETVEWSLTAKSTDSENSSLGLLGNHFISWSVECTPASAVDSVLMYNDKGYSYTSGSFGGHEVLIEIVPTVVAASASQEIKAIVTATLACGDTSSSDPYLQKSTYAKSELRFYTNPSNVDMDFNIDGKKPVDGIELWGSDTDHILSAGFSCVDCSAYSFRFYGNDVLDATETSSVTSSNFDFVTGCAGLIGSNSYIFSVTATPIDASIWGTNKIFEKELVYNTLESSYLTTNELSVVPTYVYNGSEWNKNTFVDTLTTYGASAYSMSHTEPFLLISKPDENSKIGWWKVQDGIKESIATVANNVSSLTLNVNDTIFNGNEIQIVLKREQEDVVVSGDISAVYYPTSQTPEYYFLSSVSGYVLETYGCYSITSATGFDVPKYLENIRMVDVHNPSGDDVLTATLYSPNGDPIYFQNACKVYVGMQIDNSLATSLKPAVATAIQSKWTMSFTDEDGTQKWNFSRTSLNSASALFDISTGIYDEYPGIIYHGVNGTLDINCETQIAYTVPTSPNMDVTDWGLDVVTLTTETQSIDIHAKTSMLFNIENPMIGVDDNLILNNETTSGYYVSGFDIYDSTHDVVHVDDGVRSISITGGFPHAGTYSISVTGYTVSGYDTFDVPETLKVYKFDDYSDDVERVYGETTLVFPNQISDVSIPPNEWVVADNTNRCFDALNENFQYIQNMVSFYDKSPTDYIGYVGDYMYGSKQMFGMVNTGRTDISTEQSGSLSNSSSILSDCGAVAFDDDAGCMYVVNQGKIYVVGKTSTNALKYVIDHSKMNEKVTSLRGVTVDSLGNIYTIAPDINKIIVFNKYDNSDYPCRYVTEWGGYGGATAHLKFRNPNDLCVDADDNIWVADTGNKVVKKYTKSGSWLMTISVFDGLGEDADTGIISLDVDYDGRIHVLTPSAVFVYDTDGTTYNIYTIDSENEIPVTIRKMSGAKYMYIAYSTHIDKVNLTGGVVSKFGYEIINANFGGLYHDSKRNLYISNGKNVIVYLDGVMINRVASENYKEFLWDMNEIYINQNENVQDWVINMSLHKLYDNFDLFRYSLFGRVGYVNEDGIETLQAVDFHPGDYKTLVFTPKDNIFIGINELVTSDVINRCVGQLQDCLQVLLDHI